MILIAGADECSYGSWIGHVWAAIVIPPATGTYSKPLNDSKKLSAKSRELLFEVIINESISYGIGFATSTEIEELNILKASWLALERAYNAMPIKPNKLIMDGNKIPPLPCEVEAIIKADSKIISVMAASILAKHSRTMEMKELDSIYPEYGFAQHQGYGTKKHQDAINKYGVLAMHRKTYKPIIEAISKKKLKQ